MTNMTPNEASKVLLAEMRRDMPSSRRVEQYLVQGADVNYQSEEDGYTALMSVACRNNESPDTYALLLFLLEHGANPLIKNYQGKIASDLALSHSPVYERLKNEELLFATLNNDLDGVKAALIAGADINFQGKNGYTALLIAVEENYHALVDLLLNKGAEIDIKSNDGKGVFDLATKNPILTLIHREKQLYIERTQSSSQADADSIGKLVLDKTTARGDKHFTISQLNLQPPYGNFRPAPTEKQISEIENYFGHLLPPSLKEIFAHYNGGKPLVNRFRAHGEKLISFFYSLGDDRNSPSNIWWIIGQFGEYFGPDTLPFAEGLYNEIYLLKWTNERAEVWTFMYGDIALESLDEDELEEMDPNIMPTSTYFIAESLNDLLGALYEAD